MYIGKLKKYFYFTIFAFEIIGLMIYFKTRYIFYGHYFIELMLYTDIVMLSAKVFGKK